MSTTLYDLAEDYRDILWLAQNLPADEKDESFEIALSEIGHDIKTKAENMSKVWRELMATHEAQRREANRLHERSQMVKRRADSLRQYLLGIMQGEGMKEVRWDTGSINVCGNGGERPMSIDESLLPRDYFTETLTKTVNKDAIKHALESGVEVAGVIVKERGQHVRFN